MRDGWRRPRAGRGEHGSVLVLVAGSLVLFMICTALAVDLGSLSHQIRVDQKVADLAALDAVRVLPADPTTEAQLNALRNGFPKNPGDILAVKWGPTKTGPSPPTSPL